MNAGDTCNCGAPATQEFEEGGEWFLMCDECEEATRPEFRFTLEMAYREWPNEKGGKR